MNAALRELYQRVILEHNAHPMNYGPLPDATHSATQHNPLCGDIVTLHLRLQQMLGAGRGSTRIERATFEGDSCALARASASLMTQAVLGKTTEEARALGLLLHRFLSTNAMPAGAADGQLGELTALQGVRDFPSRLRCVTLPWDALTATLDQK